jgi:hypothetical protein
MSMLIAMDVNRDGVTDLVLVTAPNITGFPWPQPLTQVFAMVSNRDDSFQPPVGREINMRFDCWDVIARLVSRIHGPCPKTQSLKALMVRGNLSQIWENYCDRVHCISARDVDC